MTARVIMVSAEVGSVAKTGGLADAVWDLASAIVDAKYDFSDEFSVHVVIPKYPWIDTSSTRRILSGILTGIEPAPYEVWESKVGGINIDYVESERFTVREGIYGESSNLDYPDNALRFSILGSAAIAVARADAGADGTATIIHGHDWHAGAALAVARAAGFSTVLTVHNAAYQGRFSRIDTHYTGCDPKYFYLEHNAEEISFLAAGFRCADTIRTVSPGYAREIKKGIHGKEIGDLGKDYGIEGVINGVDYSVWNPARDRLLPANYDVDDLSGKGICKSELQRRFGLPVNDSVPVLGMVSRLVSQKGFEELCFSDGGVIPALASRELQLVILGNGDRRYEEFLVELSDKYTFFGLELDFNDSLAHLIQGGSDFLLMPSRFEPCGLNQLYALRYGTTPIVHSTGGLADTVRQLVTGYTYKNQDRKSIVDAVLRAVENYSVDRPLHQRIVEEGMNTEFTWERTAAEYVTIYRNLAETTRGEDA